MEGMLEMIVDHPFFLESDDVIPPSAFVPIVRSQCICPASFTVDGVEWQPREPNCLVPGHGVKTRFVPQPGLKEPHRIRVQSNGKTRERE